MSNNNFLKHWPTILLGLVVAGVLILAIVSYQVKETEFAVITTVGKIEDTTPTPGLHFKWPYPFQSVYKFDRRTRCFEGNAGRLEEVLTADAHNILVSTFVNYSIKDPKKFFTDFVEIDAAENQLNSWLRSARNATFGRYDFNQIINVDPDKMKLDQIQEDIKKKMQEEAAKMGGLEIQSVGINMINVPAGISDKVFERMIAERKRAAQNYISDGRTAAENIRTEANLERAKVLADAEAEAKMTRAEADSEAAKYYEVFKENPELALFLRKLDSLRRIMKGRTTLILDTNAPPFDLLQPGADDLSKHKIEPIAKQ